MQFEDKVFMNVRCSVPYVNLKKMKQAGMQTYVSLGTVLDMGNAVEWGPNNLQDTCLRNGLVVNTEFTVCAMREDNFTIGSAEIVGVGDIIRCKCDSNFDVAGASVRDRARVCFKNLSCGKCVDSFVRESVGRALFPQYYVMHNAQRSK